MDVTIKSLKEDLRRAKKTELTDCIRKVNEEGNFYGKIPITGRKDELIDRFINFIYALLANDRRSAVADVVRIVNDQLPSKISWRFENNTVVVCSPIYNKRVCLNAKKKAVEIDQLSFKGSPFITPVERLTTIKICPASSNSRQTKLFTFSLNEENRGLLTANNSPSYQLRFYCSKYTGDTSNLLVEFPPICELRVNDCVIAGSSLRCLKGKPGTVHPPDISVMVKKKEPNSVELIYINNDSSYVASVYLVQKTSVGDLIKRMKDERVMSKSDVLDKLKQTQQDSDIIMESETLSTKDPLAFTRIITPIRSKLCHHLQCFDANIYLTMNEQTPTWTCPVCYRSIENFQDLFVDEYFDEILQNTPKHIDSVLVEPNGQITIIDENPGLAGEQSESEDELGNSVSINASKEPITILLDDDDDDDDDGIIPVVATNTAPVISQPITTTSATTTTTTAATATATATTNYLQTTAQPAVNSNNIMDITASSDDNAITSNHIPSSQPLQTETNTVGPNAPLSARKKRANVIDLTLDSDEEEDSRPQEKRARTSTENPQSSQEDLILPHPASIYNGTTSATSTGNNSPASRGISFLMNSSTDVTPEPTSRAGSSTSEFSTF